MKASFGKRGKILAAGALAGLAAAAGAAITIDHQRAEAERLFPPTGRFMTVKGVRLHYLDTGGDGQPVVMLHGNGAMTADLEISGVVDEVAKRHRTIVFDRPGYGYSTRPGRGQWGAREQARLIHTALRELGAERPILFGQSWGTLVALAMAIEFPNDVAGLVLASGFYYPESRADAAVLSAPALPVAGDVLRHTVAPFVTRKMAPSAIARMFAPLPVTERFRAEFPLPLSLRPEQIRASAEENAQMNEIAGELSRHYASLRMPVAIIAGEADEIVETPRHAIRLADEIPGSTLRLLPEMGHMLHHFEPALIAELIERVAGGAAA